MIKISLERILNKAEVKAQISAILELGGAAAVYDAGDKLLAGDANVRGPQSYEIASNGTLYGHVCGDKAAYSLSSLLNYICAAEFEKKALGQDTLDKYKEISILYNVTERFAGKLEPKEAASLIIGEVKRIIQADSVSVMFYNEKKAVLEHMYTEDETFSGMTFKEGEGIAGSVFLSGRAEIVNDVSEDPRFIKGSMEINSMMCAPLVVRDKVIGVINVSSRQAHNYSANDLRMLSALSFQAAVSVENSRLYKSLKEAFITTVYTLAETIEKRDPYTGGHTKRVMDYSAAIGEIVGLSEDELERLRLGAVVHDIGKIGVRDDVLLKNSALTDEEFDEIKRHTVYGQEILEHVDYLQHIIPAIRHHHERYDGMGYPDRLAGDDIDVIARIISVADTYDAMTSNRPYRKALSHEKALEEICKNSGRQFDPAVVRAFEAAFRLGKI